ncbi:ABC-F family ATP-binding cassette domain-containing protein [Chromobacterium paludis]|uniref:ABC-F family ATP-binding cassette domain-containing protein n=1 Tax=Chromobacterium paludis TaxID=2605945 RepID=A0A5C1DGA3_9NEIS|nr:ABC-F family ATP-binding cassette domain-containing protein [Chromobacterium paludis]QEL55029.1 ABC-F family ATP-binding cassette domain-containing protein [Chromobacterium paludis]
MPLIQLQGVSLGFSHKTCFADFSADVDWCQRIAIVGANGSGKSSLLSILNGSLEPDSGQRIRLDGLRTGFVPQIVQARDGLSGGQAVNQALSRALAEHPDLLLLDEPTNHLDADNRRSLGRMLRHFPGALVIVTHDDALLDELCDTVWHIEQGAVEVFSGRYADFLAERDRQRLAIAQQLHGLRRDQQAAHEARMKEQERASKARERGERSIAQRKWATIKSPAKLGRGNTTAGRKQAAITEQQRELSERLSALRMPQTIAPRFQLCPAAPGASAVLQVRDGSVGYAQAVLNGIQLDLAAGERLALTGKNGCGKSTLAKAIAGIAPARRLAGDWRTPPADRIGYLDQHYGQLEPGLTVLESLRRAAPDWPLSRLRHWLSDFLFCQDEEAHADVATLSGGEQARLALACIAARPPSLLVLDEATNNLDRVARQHVIEVLRDYPGAMLLISHDEDFLLQVGRVRQQAL